MAADEDEGDGGGAEQESKLADGDTAEVEGSSSTYTLTRHGSVYMCSCPAWKNQGAPVDMRTCKHLRGYLGEDFETTRLGALPSRAAATKSGSANKKETAPPVLLAHKWEVEHDPSGWWMSEKLDGIRAYWDGETFTSRLGNRFFAPDWFVADLPADTLDGELWVGRKMFQKTTSIVRSGAAGQAWKTVQFVVFDAPNAKGSFEDRQSHAQKVLERAEAPHARWHEHVLCEGFDHLREELARVEALGGEGLMLRKAGSPYVAGRSTTLLKVKTFHDAEATVIGHAPGTGKHKGRLGALVTQLPGGITFNCGTGFSDHERENPPAIGSVITFRYQELSDDGVPRFPSYVGERLDVDTPAPIAKSSRAIQTVPHAKGSAASRSATSAKTSAPDTRAVAKTSAPDTRAVAKVKAPPPVVMPEPDDEEAAEPAPRKMHPAPKLESAGSDVARGKKFMFTGKLAGMQRSQAQSKVTSIGGVSAGSVSADLDFLVVGDDGSPLFGGGAKGDKILKAEKLINQGSRLKIISETEFMRMCDRTISTPATPRPKNVMPPKPARLPDPPDEEAEEPEEVEAAPEVETDDPDSPFAKYGAVAWRRKLSNDDEDKFWNIEVRGNHHVTVFGKTGSNGQTRLADLKDPTSAKADAEKRTLVKRKEGYE